MYVFINSPFNPRLICHCVLLFFSSSSIRSIGALIVGMNLRATRGRRLCVGRQRQIQVNLLVCTHTFFICKTPNILPSYLALSSRLIDCHILSIPVSISISIQLAGPTNEPPLPRRKKCPELAYKSHEFIIGSEYTDARRDASAHRSARVSKVHLYTYIVYTFYVHTKLSIHL